MAAINERYADAVPMLGFHCWQGYWDAFFAGEEVFYGHVLGFKGLEHPVIILAVNGLRDESRGREYLRDAVTGLDDDNVGLLLKAILHGSQPDLPAGRCLPAGPFG